MSPSDLLEHEFFNAYIKTGIVSCSSFSESAFNWLLGNILMISEGRAGSDNVFTLQDG